MKTFIFALMLFCLPSSAVELTGSGIFATDYVFRGLTYSGGEPVIQGFLNLHHEAFNMGFLTSPSKSFNLDTFELEQDEEFDFFISYSKQVAGVTIAGGFNTFLYWKNSSNDTLEFTTDVSFKSLKLHSAYTNDLLNLGTNYLYNQLIFNPMITDELMFLSHAGFVYFSHPEALAGTNYFEYKVGMGYVKDSFYVEGYYTNTMFRANAFTNEAFHDARFTLSCAYNFSII